MRITYIHQHYRPPGSSGGSRPHQFARRLARDGHDVTMVAAGEGPAEVDGYAVHWIPVAYANTMGTAARIRSFLDFMVRSSLVARSLRADVILASSTPLTVAIPGIVGSRSQSAPLVFEVRDVWPELPIALGYLPRPLHSPARLLERIAYRCSERIIALSPGMEKSIKAVAPDAITTVIPNAADPEEYAHLRGSRVQLRHGLGLGDEDCLVVYAGAMGVVYDAPWIARFAVEARTLGVRVIAAGEGAGRAEALEIVRQAGLRPEEVFVGPLAKDDAMELVAAADWALSSVVDVPELEAASINKVFDAWGVGTPVLFNHGGWLAGLGESSLAGLRIPRELGSIPWDEIEGGTRSTSIDNEGRRQAALALAEVRFNRESLYDAFAHSLASAAESHRPAFIRHLLEDLKALPASRTAAGSTSPHDGRDEEDHGH